jgi:hypothetical protein
MASSGAGERVSQLPWDPRCSTTTEEDTVDPTATNDVYDIARELRDAVGEMKGSIEKRLRALERGGDGFMP